MIFPPFLFLFQSCISYSNLICSWCQYTELNREGGAKLYTIHSRSKNITPIQKNIGREWTASAAIIMPLVFSSLERIETISSAMELRAFGNGKSRTWYSGRKFEKRDYIAILLLSIIFIIAIIMTIKNGSRFYNPFR